jgi:uncharacterized protein YbaR (Trm112 family)
MPIDPQLLNILCCPKTKVDVELLSVQELKKLNEAIKKGSVKNVAGDVIDTPLNEGLITIDKKTVYRIEDDIPVMLIDEGIPFQLI